MMTRRELLKSLVVAGSAALVRIKPKKERSVYVVGRHKEFASIQDAADQMWKDQGPRPFHKAKRILVDAGVYQGPIEIDARLCPTERAPLSIEGLTGACVLIQDQPYRVSHADGSGATAVGHTVISGFFFEGPVNADALRCM